MAGADAAGLGSVALIRLPKILKAPLVASKTHSLLPWSELSAVCDSFWRYPVRK